MFQHTFFLILLLFIFLNINIVFSQSTELRESLKNTKTFYKEGKLNEAVKKYNLDKKKCFMIGDQKTDMIFAKKSQIRGFLFKEKNL